jgi:hypothetical protein
MVHPGFNLRDETSPESSPFLPSNCLPALGGEKIRQKRAAWSEIRSKQPFFRR